MEVIGDSSKSNFNGTVGWKLKSKGELVPALAEYLALA